MCHSSCCAKSHAEQCLEWYCCAAVHIWCYANHLRWKCAEDSVEKTGLYSRATHQEGKEMTTPFGVCLLKSQVLYQAAQNDIPEASHPPGRHLAPCLAPQCVSAGGRHMLCPAARATPPFLHVLRLYLPACTHPGGCKTKMARLCMCAWACTWPWWYQPCLEDTCCQICLAYSMSRD